jgi:ethanolamine ammonia-lyase small subunit
LGAYLTYNPSVGLTDESRNCISNIRPEGLSQDVAAKKIFYLINQSFRLKLSGIRLKDDNLISYDRQNRL